MNVEYFEHKPVAISKSRMINLVVKLKIVSRHYCIDWDPRRLATCHNGYKHTLGQTWVQFVAVPLVGPVNELVPLPTPSGNIGLSMDITWTTRWQWEAPYSADSVEWCPVEPYTDVLLCGTYQLDDSGGGKQETKQKRLGAMFLFKINAETTELEPFQTIQCSGILDQKWCYHEVQAHPVVVVVTSDGSIRLYKLEMIEDKLRLTLWMEETIGEDVLALSVDWSTNKTRAQEPMVVVSDSKGGLSVFRVQDRLVRVGSWKAHDFEAWIGAFNYWNPDLFYSGGDDCVFKCYDVRVCGAAVATCRQHEAGVTAVRSCVRVEHQLITGSYDEKVRLWDARSLKRPTAEVAAGGGVWRLKYHPTLTHHVLAACMYGGFRLLAVGGTVAVEKSYMEHGSIAYGADWKLGEDLVATCSFYDRRLHVSEVVFEEVRSPVESEGN